MLSGSVAERRNCRGEEAEGGEEEEEEKEGQRAGLLLRCSPGPEDKASSTAGCVELLPHQTQSASPPWKMTPKATAQPLPGTVTSSPLPDCSAVLWLKGKMPILPCLKVISILLLS